MNCKKELQDKQFILSSLFSLEEEELPEDFKDNIHYILQKENKKNPGLIYQIIPHWKYALAAAILLLFVWSVNIIIPPIPEAQRVVNIVPPIPSPNLKPYTPEKEKLLEQKIAVHQETELGIAHSPQSIVHSQQPIVNGDKVLKIDLASSEYLKNVQLKITFSENITLVGEESEIYSHRIRKDIAHLSLVPTTLLLPIKYLDEKEGVATLTFFDEEGEEFAKYSYKLLYQDGNTLQPLLGKEKEVLLTYIKDKNIPKVEAIKDDKKLSVNLMSGDICFAPVSYENALLVPNLEGKLEIFFADDTTFDITNLQMMVF